MTNEQMWEQWKDGAIEFDQLYHIFIEDIKGLVVKYHCLYGSKLKMEFDDWMSIGGYAIFDSCSKYKLGQGASLKTYVFGRVLLEFNQLLYISKLKKNDSSKYSFMALDDSFSDNVNESIYNIIEDKSSYNEYNDIIVRDLCEYFSRGDKLLSEAYYDISQGKSKRQFAKERNMHYNTLTRKLTSNKRFWEERRGVTRYENII